MAKAPAKKQGISLGLQFPSLTFFERRKFLNEDKVILLSRTSNG